MPRFAICLIAGALLSSCATLLNSRVQRIQVKAHKQIKNVTVDSTAKALYDGESFYVLRSRKPLVLHMEVDGTPRTIEIRSRNSVAFWSNIYFNYGLGMLVDWKKPWRYSYPKRLYLNYREDQVRVERFAPVRKGTLGFSFSLPHINMYYVKTDRDYFSTGGFWGIEAGLDYYFADNRYLSLNAGGAADIWVPVPAPIRYPEEYQSCQAGFASLRSNHCAGSFDLGYGINASRLTWQFHSELDTAAEERSFRSFGLGLSLSAQYKFGRFFRMGMLYQPNLVQLSYRPVLDYQHFISIEFIWKVHLRTPRGY